jgi:hypothetical protein
MTVRPANCGYLHSAFGPGCPYCQPPRTEGALDGPAAGGARGTVADEPETGRESQPS